MAPIINILLVDDDEDDYYLTSEYLKALKHWEFNITWCETYQQAEKHLDETAYDIYLFDYLLGEYTGIDLINHAQLIGCEQPIILLTGRGDTQVAVEALRLGAADFLVKSELDAEKLERCIRYALERTAVLSALRLSERRYRRIFEESNDFLFLTDLQGNITDCNPAASTLTGMKGDILRTKNIRDLIADEQFEDIWTQIPHGFVEDREVVLHADSETEKKICLFSASLEANGSQPYIQGRLHDLTARKQMEREKLFVEKMALTGRLVRMLAHEVRNPLTNVNLSAEQLEMELEDEDQKFYTQIIKRNCTRINDLISQLLQPSNMMDINLEPHSVHQILEEALSAAHDRMTLKRISIENNFHKRDIILPVDKISLQMAFLNLITNAVEAMEEGKGLLKIQTSYQNGSIQVLFTDNGSGIDEENLDKIFEPYFTKKKNGMGIGLATTMNIVHAHRGRLDVRSKLGVGTTFVISFDA
ncbi:PAS domain S-box-containing protein [Dyadobacter jejuensis]|uniref:histidine kinase n=1 Tax=Dyadobacter jejuensis TaxID=1082580 RepID=A0A316AL09_9BACT|nr:hybrid sensor histidine kinase/response regulator [Dyadobacter jejuensis]PWJ58485.1 PAS domain S-box-containing protein [Dyadobacter jejuensis]